MKKSQVWSNHYSPSVTAGAAAAAASHADELTAHCYENYIYKNMWR